MGIPPLPRPEGKTSPPPPVYDMAYHHKNPNSRHRHSLRCMPLPWRKSSQQFLRCLRTELNRIRHDLSKGG